MATSIANPGAVTGEGQLVTFALNEEEFGFDIMAVQEIIRPPKMSRVPQTPAYFEGVANLRGELLPVLDTRLRFGMATVSATDQTRVLVLDLNGAKTGLKVDRVTQVSRFKLQDMEPPPSTLKAGQSRFLRGIVKMDGGRRMIMALDPAAVCEVEIHASDVASPGHQAACGQPRTERDSAAIEQMVTFRLGKEEFSLPMAEVREILRVEEPTRVPKSPDYVLGVLTVRGRILPIVDLRTLLEKQGLAEEMGERCGVFREGWAAWWDLVRTTGHCSWQRGEDLLTGMRAWLDSLQTSSQVLIECAARVRGCLNRVSRALTSGSAELLQDLERESHLLVEAVAELERQFASHVKDDQRVVVVEAHGNLLGLVVDRVNEVLNVPADCIAPSPSVLRSSGAEIMRIIRLDDGKRLVQVLSARQLLSDMALDELCAEGAQADEDRETATGDVHERISVEEQQIVTFLLGEEEFGIPIYQVLEIDRHSRVSRVPRAPAFVEGVTNLRGDIIPVVDTRHCCRLPSRVADDRSRVIIVNIDGCKTGLAVDSVREVLGIRQRDISPPPRAISSTQEHHFISGIARIDDGKRMIVLLNAEQILSNTQREELAATAGDDSSPAATSQAGMTGLDQNAGASKPRSSGRKR